MTSGDSPTASTGRAVVGAAQEKAEQVSATAGKQASHTASVAGQQAGEVAGQAKAQAGALVEEAKGSLRRQGEAQASQMANAIERLRDEAGALLEGRPEAAPSLVERGRPVVDQLDQLSRRLRSDGLDGALRDLQGFARGRPLAFLAGAGVAGFAVGRLARAQRESGGGSQSGQQESPGDRWPQPQEKEPYSMPPSASPPPPALGGTVDSPSTTPPVPPQYLER